MSDPGEDVPELQLLEPDWLELELECEWLRDLDRERLDPEFEPDSLPDLLDLGRFLCTTGCVSRRSSG